jgi:hypothetical protein
MGSESAIHVDFVQHNRHILDHCKNAEYWRNGCRYAAIASLTFIAFNKRCTVSHFG